MQNVASLSLRTRKLDVQFISRSDKYRKPVALFSSHNRLNQESVSDREDFSEGLNRFLGATNLSSDSLTRQMLRNLFLMEIEIICLLKRDLNS